MLELSNAYGCVSADPQGAQVLVWDKRVAQTWVPVLYAGESRKRTGIPVLFPYFGALKDGLVASTGKPLGQHGFARDCAWKERRVSATEGFFELTERDIPDAARAAYPWPFLARLKLELTDAGDLRMTLSVRNSGDHPMPIAPGLHPYFAVPHADKRHISAKLDGAGGPVPDFGIVDWDTDTSTRFIAWGSPLSVRFPDGRVLRIAEESKRPGFPWLAVWSGGAGDYLCVEPAAGLPDAINQPSLRVDASLRAPQGRGNPCDLSCHPGPEECHGWHSESGISSSGVSPLGGTLLPPGESWEKRVVFGMRWAG